MTTTANTPKASSSTLLGGRLARAVRLALGALPLFWLAQRVSLADVARDVPRVGWSGLAASLACALAAIACAGVRWGMLLRAYGARTTPSALTLTRWYLVSIWFALLPSGLAGDAVRGYRVREYVKDLPTSYTVIVVERICGFVGLLVVAVSASLAGDGHASQRSLVEQALRACVAAGLALGVGALAGPYVVAKVPALQRAIGAVPVVGRVLVQIPPATSVAWVVAAAAASVVVQGLSVAVIGVLVAHLVPGVGVVAWGTVVPFIMLGTFIPVTPGGIGQRELVFQYFLGWIGVGAAPAIAIAEVAFAVGLVPALLGGLLYVLERESPRAT